MSDEKTRYTRLKSIKDFGYDVDWMDLREKSVVVAGVGGLGMITAEMLARCGIGKLFLFDRDVVDVVNLNRLGFHERHLGDSKVEVIEVRIQSMNPDVETIAHHGDIMLFENESRFEEALTDADVCLMGVDNYPARTFVNRKCMRLKTVLLDAGAARSGLSGHVHPIFPGINACIQCTGIIEASGERGEPCTASLPTTMAILAGLQVQECLKILLGFGNVVDYLTYNAITGTFRNLKTRRDENCPACSDM
mgnify:CR=1 FL=1